MAYYNGRIDVLSISPLKIVVRLDSQTSEPVDALAFAWDNKTILSGNNNGTVQLWQVSTGRELGAIFRGLGAPVSSLEIDPAGNVTCGFSDNRAGIRRFIAR